MIDFIKETKEKSIVDHISDFVRKKQEEAQTKRTGIHASDIIKSQKSICLRELILSRYYCQNKQIFNDCTNRILLQGEYTHKKYQDIFVQSKIAKGIEVKALSKDYNLYHTVDAIIEISNILYIVEIKSLNNSQFQKTKTHRQAEKQIQLYMHLHAIPHGIILLENKDTQDIKIQIVNYELQKVIQFLTLLDEINRADLTFQIDRLLPPRLLQCKTQKSQRTNYCKYRDACFNISRKQIQTSNY